MLAVHLLVTVIDGLGLGLLKGLLAFYGYVIKTVL
jgi:hypothetical protein